MALDLSPNTKANNENLMGKFNYFQQTSAESPFFFESLNKLQVDLHTLKELHQILESLVYVGRDLINCDDASIVLWNSAQKEFVGGASTTGVGSEVSKRVRRKEGATRWIIDNQKPKFVEDTNRDLAVSNLMISENQIGAYAGVPILSEGECLGVFYALFRQNQPFYEGDRYKLIQLVSVASVSIKHARQIQILEEQNKLLISLMDATLQNMVQPLSLAMGFCDLLVDEIEAMSAEHKKRLGVIQKSHTQMHHFISEFQRFERLMTGNNLELEPVCINYVAQIVGEAFKDISVSHKSEVEVLIDPATPTVLGDMCLLVESVKELVGRITQHASENPHIVIRTMNHVDHVMIGVEDALNYSHKGEQRLTDPRSAQAVQARTAPHESLAGLGLKYVRVIVEMHGGYVHIKGPAQKGSQFQIFLPKFSDTNQTVA